jgi:Flp pilus assembly secretin CpaC
MRNTIGSCAVAVLLITGVGARAQEGAEEIPQEEAKAPGSRLSVRFEETRLSGDSTTSSRACTLSLHADAGGARLFEGTEEVITVHEREATTRLFKNAGITAEVKAASLPDGRYRLDARFEESSALGAGAVTSGAGGENPILKVVKGESAVTLREGETVPFVSAVDPITGEVVRVDVTVHAAPAPRAVPMGRTDEGRLRGRLVLVRRKGETQTVRRPYTVLLKLDGDEGSSVFSGSQLPVQVKMQERTTVAFKDVGAGLRIKAHRVADGRYRLDLEFDDLVLVPGGDAPRVRGFKSESQVFVREGETLTIASAVDSVSGETVEAQLALERAR